MPAINAQKTRFVSTKTVRTRKSGATEETQPSTGPTMTPSSTDCLCGTIQLAITATALITKTNFVTSLETISKRKTTKMISLFAKKEFRLTQLASKTGTLLPVLFPN